MVNSDSWKPLWLLRVGFDVLFIDNILKCS